MTNTWAQNTYIPDDNFEQALIDLGLDVLPLNDSVPTANIDTLTHLQLVNKGIVSLEGIDGFSDLRTLIVILNPIDSLDLSSNLQLNELNCMDNNLKSLVLGPNTNLTGLWCPYNQIEQLDVSQNTALTDIQCDHNLIDTLDVSVNMALKTLICQDNQLDHINLGNIPVERLRCENNQLTNIDLTSSIMLVKLLCSNNLLDSLDAGPSLNLDTIECYNNQLVSIDVGSNLNLKYLNCGGNPLTQIDPSQNALLESLICSYTQLMDLNITSNVALTRLDCSNNILRSLNVQNENNTNFVLFDATNNHYLECIQVDNVDFSNDNWTNIDTPAFFSENCLDQINSAGAVSQLMVSDIANNGNASDISVSFYKAVDESTIDEYRVIIVRSEDMGMFAHGHAEALPMSSYTSVLKTGSNLTVVLSADAKDKDGDLIEENVAYNVFILSVADGTNASVNTLSDPSSEFALTGGGGVSPTNIGGLSGYNDQLTISQSSDNLKVLSKLDNLTISLVNIQGRKLAEYGIEKGINNIPVNNLSKGVYFILVNIDDSLLSRKFYVN